MTMLQTNSTSTGVAGSGRCPGRIFGWTGGRAVLSLVLAVVALLTLGGRALALDVLVLKDGRRLEGEIVRESERFVEFKIIVGDIEQTNIYPTKDIAEVIRDTKPEVEEPKRPVRQSETPKAAEQVDPNATRVAFVTLGDPKDYDRGMVGTYINARVLREIGQMFREMPEDERPEVLVLEVNSGGGALSEVEPLSNAIHNDLKRDFRVVAWIRSAISAAMMTSWNCEEIVMMPQGNIGGSTAWYGAGQKVDGRQLQQVLQMGEQLSSRGRHNPLIARAMQIPIDLSCDIDEDGNIIWYEGKQGEHLLNTADPMRILTLNSVDAVKYGVAIGIATTKDELAEVLNLTSWREVAPEGERRMREYREDVWGSENSLNLAYAAYQRYVSLASGSGDRRTRGGFVNQARQQLSRMKAIVRDVPALEMMIGISDQWFRDQEKLLEDLMRR
ncbi:MAG: hypothetical protein ACTS3F_09305 [Phycisphaerales bacterium]